MYSYVTDNGGDPNDSVGNTAGRILVANIQDTRDMIEGLNLGKTIPVGNSDAGYYFNDLVLAEIDYGVSFLQPNYEHGLIFLEFSCPTSIPGSRGLLCKKRRNGPLTLSMRLTSCPLLHYPTMFVF